MILWITIYISIGFLFIMFVEWCYSFEDHNDPLTNPERVFLSLLWPIGFVAAIHSLINYLLNRK